MNEYVQFAKDTITRMDKAGPTRADTSQAYAAVAIACALIGLAEILEQGLTSKQ